MRGDAKYVYIYIDPRQSLSGGMECFTLYGHFKNVKIIHPFIWNSPSLCFSSAPPAPHNQEGVRVSTRLEVVSISVYNNTRSIHRLPPEGNASQLCVKNIYQ